MSFDPSTLPGLAIWLDASRMPQVNGQDVNVFTDYSGSGRHGQLMGGPPPTMRTGVNGLNGLPVLRMTAGQGRFVWYNTTADKDYTLAYVGRMWDTTSANQGRVITINGDYGNFLIGFWGSYMDCMFCNPNWIVPNGAAPTSPGATTAWKLYSADGNTVGQTVPNFIPRLFSNGALLGTGTSTATQGFSGALQISGSSIPLPAESSSCEIAELLLFNRKLSDVDRQRVEAYLRAKWMTTTAPTRLVETLQDSFDTTLDRTKWLASTGAPNVYYDAANQRVGIQCSPSYYTLKTATAPLGFNLLNSSVYAKITPSAVAVGKEFVFAVQDATRTNHFSFSIYGTDLHAWSNPEPGGNDYATIPYDPVAHQWLRIRADSQIVYWDTSPDGRAWSNLTRTVFLPTTAVIDAWCVNFSQGGPAGQPDAFVDYVNMPSVDQSYAYGGYGDGPYGSPPPIWEPLQGPAGPPGLPDLGQYRTVSGRVQYGSGWSEYAQPFGNSYAFRDRQGVCYYNATVQAPANPAAGAIVAYAPWGMWPANRVMLPGLVGNPQTCCRVDINTDGGIQINSTLPAGESFAALDLVWSSPVPKYAVLDGLVVTSVVFVSGTSYTVTYTAGRMVDTAGNVYSFPAGTGTVVASGSLWWCLSMMPTGAFVASNSATSNQSDGLTPWNIASPTASGALLIQFAVGTGVRSLSVDRRWLVSA